MYSHTAELLEEVREGGKESAFSSVYFLSGELRARDSFRCRLPVPQIVSRELSSRYI